MLAQCCLDSKETPSSRKLACIFHESFFESRSFGSHPLSRELGRPILAIVCLFFQDLIASCSGVMDFGRTSVVVEVEAL